MLQQTRVEAVRQPYERFMARFPRLEAFARASDDELLAAWRGLGYYRRARLLRDGARAVLAEHGGQIPGASEALGALPGIGDYTRGAIASIAFGRAEPAIDGNVERVVARHRGIRDDVKSAAGRAAVRAVVHGWLDARRAGDFNQALMELGAVICTPREPACERCPIAADCTAAAEGRTAELPVRRPRRPPVAVHPRVVVARRGGSALGHRVPGGEPNAGQIDLPGAGILRTVDADALAAVLARRFRSRVEVGAACATIRHAITHYRVELTAHAARVVDRGDLSWHRIDGDTPWTTPARKVFAALRAAGGDERGERA
jgi:A/G-specific adenine glycosylase